jgi:hypothetical protein
VNVDERDPNGARVNDEVPRHDDEERRDDRSFLPGASAQTKGERQADKAHADSDIEPLADDRTESAHGDGDTDQCERHREKTGRHDERPRQRAAKHKVPDVGSKMNGPEEHRTHKEQRDRRAESEHKKKQDLEGGDHGDPRISPPEDARENHAPTHHAQRRAASNIERKSGEFEGFHRRLLLAPIAQQKPNGARADEPCTTNAGRHPDRQHRAARRARAPEL